MLHLVAEQYDFHGDGMTYGLLSPERIKQLDREDLDRYHRSILKPSSYCAAMDDGSHSKANEAPDYQDELQSKLLVLMDMMDRFCTNLKGLTSQSEVGSEPPMMNPQPGSANYDYEPQTDEVSVVVEVHNSEEKVFDEKKGTGFSNSEDMLHSEEVLVSASAINSRFSVNPSLHKQLMIMDSGFKVLSIYFAHMAPKWNDVLKTRPTQRNYMCVEVYYNQFFNWRKKLEEVNYLGNEDSYIDDFLYGLKTELAVRIWVYKWKPRTLYGAFRRAEIEETMMNNDVHMVFDKMPHSNPIDIQDAEVVLYENDVVLNASGPSDVKLIKRATMDLHFEGTNCDVNKDTASVITSENPAASVIHDVKRLELAECSKWEHNDGPVFGDIIVQKRARKVFAGMTEPFLVEYLMGTKVTKVVRYMFDERPTRFPVNSDESLYGTKNYLSPFPYIIDTSSSDIGSTLNSGIINNIFKVSIQDLSNREYVLGVSETDSPSLPKLGFNPQVFDPGTLSHFKYTKCESRLHYICSEAILIYSQVYDEFNVYNHFLTELCCCLLEWSRRSGNNLIDWVCGMWNSMEFSLWNGNALLWNCNITRVYNSIRNNDTSTVTHDVWNNRPFADFYVGASPHICTTLTSGHYMVLRHSDVYITDVGILIQMLPFVFYGKSIMDHAMVEHPSHTNNNFEYQNASLQKVMHQNTLLLEGLKPTLVWARQNNTNELLVVGFNSNNFILLDSCGDRKYAMSYSSGGQMSCCILPLGRLTDESDLVTSFCSWIGLLSPLRTDFAWDPGIWGTFIYILGDKDDFDRVGKWIIAMHHTTEFTVTKRIHTTFGEFPLYIPVGYQLSYKTFQLALLKLTSVRVADHNHGNKIDEGFAQNGYLDIFTSASKEWMALLRMLLSTHLVKLSKLHIWCHPVKFRPEQIGNYVNDCLMVSMSHFRQGLVYYALIRQLQARDLCVQPAAFRSLYFQLDYVFVTSLVKVMPRTSTRFHGWKCHWESRKAWILLVDIEGENFIWNPGIVGFVGSYAMPLSYYVVLYGHGFPNAYKMNNIATILHSEAALHWHMLFNRSLLRHGCPISSQFLKFGQPPYINIVHLQDMGWRLAESMFDIQKRGTFVHIMKNLKLQGGAVLWNKYQGSSNPLMSPLHCLNTESNNFFKPATFEGILKLETYMTSLHSILAECFVLMSRLEPCSLQFFNDISSAAFQQVLWSFDPFAFDPSAYVPMTGSLPIDAAIFTGTVCLFHHLEGKVFARGG